MKTDASVNVIKFNLVMVMYDITETNGTVEPQVQLGPSPLRRVGTWANDMVLQLSTRYTNAIT